MVVVGRDLSISSLPLLVVWFLLLLQFRTEHVPNVLVSDIQLICDLGSREPLLVKRSDRVALVSVFRDQIDILDGWGVIAFHFRRCGFIRRNVIHIVVLENFGSDVFEGVVDVHSSSLHDKMIESFDRLFLIMFILYSFVFENQ